MTQKLLSAALLCTASVLVACGGRVAQPIAVSNAWDTKLSCSHLQGENENLEKRLIELTGERKDKPMHNVGMLISSPLFLDLSKAQKEEATSIYKRQEHLQTIMLNKNCAPAETAQN